MKKILRATMIALLALVCGQATAVTVTFDPAVDKGTQEGSSQGEDQVSKDGITIMVTPKGSFGNGKQYRIYQGGSFTVSSTIGNIAKIEVICENEDTKKYGPGHLQNPTSGVYTYDGYVGTWTGDTTEVSFGACTSQVRILWLTIFLKDNMMEVHCLLY